MNTQKLSRLTFGKLTSTEYMKITPCWRGGVGAVLLEKGGQTSFISDDVALVFETSEEVERLIASLLVVKKLIKEQKEALG
jgi:hypothetical protein